MLTTFIYFILPAILLILGIPIFLTLFVTSIVIVLVTGLPTESIQIYIFGSLDNYPLLAVPFFVLAGEIMAQGGIARRIVVWVISLVGGIRGSLAVTTVAASEIFGAMTHTAVGTVIAVGRMIYPSLRDNGYDERFSVGTHCLLGCDRSCHTAIDCDDYLLDGGAAVGNCFVYCRHTA